MHGRPTRDPSGTALSPARPPWSVVIRCFAFVRKEIVEIVRQPRLIGLLVVGPFALLMLLGIGYGNDSFVKRSVFVAREDSIYAEVLERYEEQLDSMLESRGMVTTEAEGRRMLADGDVDVVVVFPDDPLAAVASGEQAIIRVLHDEIDPFQEQAVDIAARLAVQEVNSTVLERVVTEAGTELSTSDQYADTFLALAETAESNPEVPDEARTQLTSLDAAVTATTSVLDRLSTEDREAQADLDETARLIEAARVTLSQFDDGATDAERSQLGADLDALSAQLGDSVILDPAVLVRPFTSDTENVGVASVSPMTYFTPSSLALLLQHLSLTFAALSLVRDRRTGLFELMRVGPLSSVEIVIGKILAYVLIGAVVAAALFAASIFALGVGLAGSLTWLAVLVLGVLLSSLSLGMILATISKTESQAVQFAMLALLASLFFTGFVLPLEALRFPVKIISWMLPVTYGIEGFHDVMLRGVTPTRDTLLGLGALVVGYGGIAITALTRRLKNGDE